MSDLSVLRWRIDQQSELIMRLKLKLDESNSKLKVQEKIHEDTSKLNTLLVNQIQEGDRKIFTMGDETSKLTAAIEELVKVRDNLKSEIRAHQADIARIEKESKAAISAVIDDKTSQVKELNKLVAAAQVKLAQIETEYNQIGIFNEAESLVHERELMESIHLRTKTELERVTEEVETELAESVSKLHEVEKRKENQLNQRSRLIEKCEKGNEELICSVEKTAKQIEEEKIKQDVLEKEHAKLTEDLARIEEKYKDEKYLINPDLLIEKLTYDLDEILLANDKAMKEFAAYQKHSAYLINREQVLNKRFRMLSFRDDEEERERQVKELLKEQEEEEEEGEGEENEGEEKEEEEEEEKEETYSKIDNN